MYEVYQNLSEDSTEGINIRKEPNGEIKLTVVSFDKAISVYLTEKQIRDLQEHLKLFSEP